MIVILSISLVIFIGNLAINEINPEADSLISSTILSSYGNETTFTTNTYNSSDLPDASQSADADTGNVFTDLFNTAKNWLIQSTGARYVIDFVTAPYTLLANIQGLPPVIAFAIGTAWYGLIIFLFVSWIFNR